MTGLVRLAFELQNFFIKENWEFCIIGGVAHQNWGEPRTTQDVDITLLTGFGCEEKFVDRLLTQYEGRIESAREFALDHRVLLLKSSNGIGIDIALGGLPFEEQAVSRSVFVEYAPNLSLRICSAEDYIIFKSFASRPRDWLDIESVLIRDQKSLDWDYILNQLSPLAALKEEPEIVSHLLALRKSLG